MFFVARALRRIADRLGPRPVSHRVEPSFTLSEFDRPLDGCTAEELGHAIWRAHELRRRPHVRATYIDMETFPSKVSAPE